jgi:hypothetical protein
MKWIKNIGAFAFMLVLSAFLSTLSPAISMADGNPNCSVNWVNGACGAPTSDGGAHKGAEVQSELREKPCPEHQGKDV